MSHNVNHNEIINVCVILRTVFGVDDSALDQRQKISLNSFCGGVVPIAETAADLVNLVNHNNGIIFHSFQCLAIDGILQ